MKPILISVALMITIIQFQCSPGGGVACAAYAAAGLSVTVKNKSTGSSICDAIVKATEGSYTETLNAMGGQACNYTGAYERAGKYTVTAEKIGFAIGQTTNVKVVEGTGECPHVIQTSVEIQLVPAP